MCIWNERERGGVIVTKREDCQSHFSVKVTCSLSSPLKYAVLLLQCFYVQFLPLSHLNKRTAVLMRDRIEGIGRRWESEAKFRTP